MSGKFMVKVRTGNNPTASRETPTETDEIIIEFDNYFIRITKDTDHPGSNGFQILTSTACLIMPKVSNVFTLFMEKWHK